MMLWDSERTLYPMLGMKPGAPWLPCPAIVQGCDGVVKHAQLPNNSMIPSTTRVVQERERQACQRRTWGRTWRSNGRKTTPFGALHKLRLTDAAEPIIAWPRGAQALNRGAGLSEDSLIITPREFCINLNDEKAAVAIPRTCIELQPFW